MKFIWQIEGTISRGWSYRSSIYVGGQHAAVDIPAATGTPIKAVAAGVVISVAKDMYSGFFVGIDHIDGWQSFYRHMYSQSPVVVDQIVGQGQIIGNVGSTGWSTDYHLHFDLWSKDPIEGAFRKHNIWAVDPELYLGVEIEEEDNMKLLFYRFGKTIYIIRPDGKRRKINFGEWKAHKAGGAIYIQVAEDPSKIARA